VEGQRFGLRSAIARWSSFNDIALHQRQQCFGYTATIARTGYGVQIEILPVLFGIVLEWRSRHRRYKFPEHESQTAKEAFPKLQGGEQ
jgi:hypothetical protein